MSITPLSAARIAGEVGLGIGTITGGSCAAKYSNQLAIQAVKIEGHDDQVSAAKNNGRKGTQYAISCFNSINSKSSTQEAMNCKSHMNKHLQNKIDINWQHGAPGDTEAGKNG